MCGMIEASSALLGCCWPEKGGSWVCVGAPVTWWVGELMTRGSTAGGHSVQEWATAISTEGVATRVVAACLLRDIRPLDPISIDESPYSSASGK